MNNLIHNLLDTIARENTGVYEFKSSYTLIHYTVFDSDLLILAMVAILQQPLPIINHARVWLSNLHRRERLRWENSPL